MSGGWVVNTDNNAYTGCPGEPMIPWYLILGGCLTIVLLVVRVLLARVGDHMSHYYSTVLFLVLWMQGGLHHYLRHSGAGRDHHVADSWH